MQLIWTNKQQLSKTSMFVQHLDDVSGNKTVSNPDLVSWKDRLTSWVIQLGEICHFLRGNPMVKPSFLVFLCEMINKSLHRCPELT